MNIYFLLPSLYSGGAERVTLKIIKYVKSIGAHCTLVVLDCAGQLGRDVPSGVELRCLNTRRARGGIFKLYNEMRRGAPDIVFSTIGNLNILVSFISLVLAKKPRLIVRESSVMSRKHSKGLVSRIWMIMYGIAYKRVHTVICQSEYMRKDLLEEIRVDPRKLTIINNPVERIDVARMAISYWSGLSESTLKLLAVGRLEKVKRFDLMIEMVSKLGRPFVLIILGEGRERSHLENLIREMGLGDKIKLPGYVSDPHPYYQAADLLLMTSAYEGFPNVVLEANAYGTPVLAFDVPGGINEIIEDDLNGKLIEEGKTDLFIDEIHTWEKTRFDRLKISNRILSRFSPDEIRRKYISVFVEENRYANK